MQAIPIVLAAGAKIFAGAAAKKAGDQQGRALDAQAHNELVANAEQEARVREDARKAIGEQVSAQFSNGFEGGTGSAIDALAESQTNAALDVMMLRRGATAKATSLRTEGSMARSRGKMELIGSLIGAAGTAAQGYSDWKKG